MECLSRVISYTVFIAFLYFLTVITHPPSTTNPCLLYPKNFIFWPLPNLFSSSVGGQIRPAAPGGQGDVEAPLGQVLDPKTFEYFNKIYMTHIHLCHFLYESFMRGENWNPFEQGEAFLCGTLPWPGWKGDENKEEFSNDWNHESNEIGQAGELGSRVEDWVDAVGRCNF